MDGQSIVVAVIVVIATLYVLRTAWRAVASTTCTTGCGKCDTPKPGLIQIQIRKSAE